LLVELQSARTQWFSMHPILAARPSSPESLGHVDKLGESSKLCTRLIFCWPTRSHWANSFHVSCGYEKGGVSCGAAEVEREPALLFV